LQHIFVGIRINKPTQQTTQPSSVEVYIVMVGTCAIEIALGAISIAPQQSTDHILAGQTAT
jgi:hypothetical protein